MSVSFSLERALERASDDLDRIADGLGRAQRLDVSGLPAGLAGLLLARRPQPTLVVTPDAEHAQRLRADLSFFSAGGPAGDTEARDDGTAVLGFPAADTTPFLDVAPDRRAAMDRLGTLFHLSHGLPFRCVVAPVAALLRRVPPRDHVRAHSMVIERGAEVDRDALLSVLTHSGYLRVPEVEDPGSFSVRGNLIDVFPPRAAGPARIELDFDEVASIVAFDPEDQRTGATLARVAVHPVHDIMLGEGERALAQERVSELCDAINMPTARRRQLVDDIGAGRAFLGLDSYLPAFYPTLSTLFDYLPEGCATLLVDPLACGSAVTAELERASRDHGARVEDGKPSFEIPRHYLSPTEVSDHLEAGPVAVLHRVAIGGALDEQERDSPLSRFSEVDPDALLQARAHDQQELLAALRARRQGGDAQAPLAPLVDRLRNWLDEGMRVWLIARTEVQAGRLHHLLSGYGLSLRAPAPYDPGLLDAPPDDRVRILVGSLEDGFVLPAAALACVTETEIFGRRRTTSRTRRKRDARRAFVEDLRQLQLGDYVVHSEHGIGRYQGLSTQEVPVSQYEALQGMKPRRLEVLVVEYAGGDRLYLPVTRLNQIEKFSGADGASPKLDKLGGQTFARKVARAETAVKQLADELLSLYAARAARTRPPYPAPDRLYEEFEATFPYDETVDQAQAIEDVLSDLRGERPMDRLVCGDVGFGKTEVAMRGAFRVAMAGRQVALLCPTTVLAQQHAASLAQRMEDYPIRLEVLSRFVPRQKQREVIAGLKDGTVDIVVGTHRLLSKDVHFKDLGLLVVDEEQRFGVTHKERIKKLRTDVDVLTLSATPIPRTLQLSMGGLRDLSLITTPPLDRRAVRTFVTRWDDHVVREAIERELARAGQVFFIHNRIDNLYERASRLQELVPHARIATTHGRLKAATLETLMTDFVEGRYDVLCSTAIIENGLDIPRANTILIDRADMFGLSQLYQLRGRVGRSRERAYCYLIAPPPSTMSDDARSRIEALERFSQLGAGFQIASLDMELRGAGDLLGAEQSGSVAAVGFDRFVHMLQEAIAELRGEEIVHEVDPELTFTIEHYLPDDYVEDVGLRLSMYKRLATAVDEAEVDELSDELRERFGEPPREAERLVAVMRLKPALRRLRVLGCEASGARVTLHFREDTPLPAARLIELVGASRRYSLSPEMKLTCRAGEGEDADALLQASELVATLERLVTEKNP